MRIIAATLSVTTESSAAAIVESEIVWLFLSIYSSAQIERVKAA